MQNQVVQSDFVLSEYDTKAIKIITRSGNKLFLGIMVHLFFRMFFVYGTKIIDAFYFLVI